LAALMALLMMGLVILDTGDAAREKITVQSAADAAAWSEAAVEARAMNMMALANIGKRITIGMTAFYDALWYSFGAIAAMIGIVATISCIAAFFTAGIAGPICEKSIEIGIHALEIILPEAPDGASFALSLNTGYFLDDVVALDNYQKYMADLAPWWAYAEGIQRGIRNGATISASFPVPESKLDQLEIP